MRETSSVTPVFRFSPAWVESARQGFAARLIPFWPRSRPRPLYQAGNVWSDKTMGLTFTLGGISIPSPLPTLFHVCRYNYFSASGTSLLQVSPAAWTKEKPEKYRSKREQTSILNITWSSRTIIFPRCWRKGKKNVGRMPPKCHYQTGNKYRLFEQSHPFYLKHISCFITLLHFLVTSEKIFPITDSSWRSPRNPYASLGVFCLILSLPKSCFFSSRTNFVPSENSYNIVFIGMLQLATVGGQYSAIVAWRWWQQQELRILAAVASPKM